MSPVGFVFFNPSVMVGSFMTDVAILTVLVLGLASMEISVVSTVVTRMARVVVT